MTVRRVGETPKALARRVKREVPGQRRIQLTVRHGCDLNAVLVRFTMLTGDGLDREVTVSPHHGGIPARVGGAVQLACRCGATPVVSYSRVVSELEQEWQPNRRADILIIVD